MRCHNCGGSYQHVKGPLRIDDPYIGPFEVDVPEYLKCDQCGEYLLPGRWAEEVDRARARRLEELLRSQPLQEFITAAETAKLLGISRQALHKNRRIKQGFIYHTRFGRKTVFLKKSVELFKKVGDGRFPLWKPFDYLVSNAVGCPETQEPLLRKSAQSTFENRSIAWYEYASRLSLLVREGFDKLRKEIFAHQCETPLDKEREVYVGQF